MPDSATAHPLNKKSLHSVVDHLLRRGGDRIAIEEAGARLDYATLDARSRRLARALKAAGIAPGHIVASPLPAGIDHVVALLATVRAGGIFLALDPHYPDARLRQILAQACPTVVLAAREGDAAARIAACAGQPLPVLPMAAHDEGAEEDNAPLPIVAGEDDTGYLIHTSGSTGTPKLIAGRNKGISHFVHWETGELGLDDTVRASFLAPPTFDVSLREVFVPLLAGGTLVVPAADVRTDAARLADWLREARVSLLHIVPSLFRVLIRALRDSGAGALPELRHACTAGEPLYGADVAAWRAAAGPGTELINLYGPSETTLAKAFHRVDRETYAPGAIVPIGQPIANSALLILRNGRLAEIGEIGEIHIRTPFASNGYWNDPVRTAESFIVNPLAPEAGDRIYRTGDLGRYRHDRSVEFVGRADRQVKIDGVRIELPEIEGALRGVAGIEEAAAQVFRLNDGSATLVGYYAGPAAPGADAVRAQLGAQLPSAMIPSHLVALPALPKNLNGKIDRKALPRPESLLTDSQQAAPQGETETRLAALWAEALGVERVGAESPWLAIGGNSLRAIGLIGRITREFSAHLSIRDFLEHATVRAQARLIASRQGEASLPLERVADADTHPLTDGQRRLWILSRLEQGQALYNNVEWLQLDGEVDPAALQQAFQVLVARHEGLRTVFPTGDDGEPRQRILPTLDLPLPLHALPGGTDDADTARAALVAALKRERATPFDLASGPLLRLSLWRESATRHHLLINMHHIVCDGWSMGILVPDLVAAYARARGHDQAAAPAPAFRPRDVAAWLARMEDTPAFGRCRDYWRTRLADADQRAHLPTDPPAVDAAALAALQGEAGQVEVALAQEQITALRQLLAERQATPFMAVAVALATLLYRYGGRDTVVIGTPVAGREQPGLDEVVGFFVNTLPLVLRLAPDLSFAALLEQAREAVAGLQAHQLLPFDRLLADHGDARDPLRNPLFEVFLAAEPAPRALALDGLAVTEHEVPDPPARYDLTLRLSEEGAHWKMVLEYRRSLWRPAFMARFARHLSQWLEAAIAAPDLPLARLPMLSADELAQLDAWSRGPLRDMPDWTLHGRFAAQAAATPQAPALVWAETLASDQPPATLSYAELAARVDTFAAALTTLGIVPDEARTEPAVVGVLLPRGADWPAAMLATLRQGAVALPLDARHPPARLEELLRDAEVRALIAPPDLLPHWQSAPRLDPAHLPAHDGTLPPPASDPARAAYLIHTSGSTGTPKGVLVPHRAFANMMADQIEALGVGPGDRVLQFVSPAFDVAVFELFLALHAGAALAMPPRDEIEDAGLYPAWVARLGASVAMLTPGFLHALADPAVPGLRLLISGGEAPIASDARRCLAAGIRYVNAYGPTECAVNAALHELGADTDWQAPIPLGRPTANTRLQVVAPDLSPLPDGVPGELLISGAGVALGYLHRQALTARLFGVDADGVRHYRSGDLARREADGRLVFVGRADSQVKVRGHRVELGEIEATVRALPGVETARVLARPLASGEKELLLYWTGDATLDGGELAARLATRLPAHELPAHCLRLERFPLTVNGKLDVARLPAPDAGAPPAGDEPPRNAQEAALVALWREVLELPEAVALGRHADFFALGGRSLAANRLALRAARALGRPVPLRDLYAAPTPAGLLARLAGGSLGEIPRLADDQPAPLSPMQRRLWIINRLGESGGVYHIAALLRLEGELDVVALRAAFADLCQRQSVLRGRIVADAAGEPWQVLDAAGEPPFTLHEGTAADPESLAQAPFDLAAEWPLRVHLWRREANAWELLVVLHHLAGDGWSMPILARELSEAYNARRAGSAPAWAPLPAHYREVAAWMARQLAEGAQQADADYWRQRLAGELPLLDLPTDRPRPPVRRYHGATVELPLPAASLAALRDIAARQSATPFAAFLALVQVLLARLARQDDLIVGVPVAGRAHPASEGLVGFFVNTLPLRARMDPQQAFTAHLASSAALLAEAQQHQAYPFDRLVEDLDVARDTARSPVFDVLVSLDEASDAGLALDGLATRALPLARHGARCDLWWLADLAGDTPMLRVEYDSDLFDAATVADWATRLLRLIDAAHAEPTRALGALPWLDGAERAALIAAGEGAVSQYGDTPLIDRFEAIARARPEAPALIDDQGSLSYGALDRAANALAGRIAAWLGESAAPPRADLGVPLVALMLERGRAMPLAQLAVLKAGAAYLPIEPDSPAERVQALIDDAGATLLLHAPGVEAPPLPATTRVRALPEAAAGAMGNEGSDAPPPRRLGFDDAIYVMYTSGSTGRPKGVVATHRAVARLVADTDYYRPEAGDRLLQLSNYAFDGATFDFYAAFSHGLPLCLPDREAVLDSARLADFIHRHGVNVAFMTTAQLNRLADQQGAALAAFRRLYFGGQEASLPHVRRAHAVAGKALVHVYGPTEVTTFSCWHPVSAADLGEQARRLPIGRPIAATRALVLDANGEPQPDGVPGELWLGGPGVARGYLGQPALSAERFLPSPFLPGDRLYRSGDLCLRRRDGVIEFLGRLDGQVKIRGYRVELGEIEGRLAGAPGVEKAFVTALPGSGGNLELAAYLTARAGDAAPTLASLHAHLSRWLPPYMIPAHFVLLPALPINANGKVDRRALPPPLAGTPGLLTGGGGGEGHALPGDPAQAALHAAWRSVLGQDDIGLNDNYFALGGDSIQALQIVARLRQAGWTLKVTDLLRTPTIAGLAPLLQQADQGVRPGAADDGRVPPLSAIQRWFLAQDFATPAHFNQSMLLRLDGAPSEQQLADALALLWRQHAGLRLVPDASQPEGQRLLPADAPPRPVTLRCADAAALLADAQQRQRGFDLAKGPLLSATRYQLPDGERLLLLAHHWIIDGVSWRILLEDLRDALAGTTPAPAGASLSAWQRGLADSARFDAQRDYWHQQALAEVLPLPRVAGEAGAAPIATRRLYEFVLPPGPAQALTASGHAAYQTRGDELLLAAWTLALARALGAAPDQPAAVRLALESHGRDAVLEGVDVERTVGWFTALFPLRLAISTQAPATLIREVKEALRAIPERGIGHGVLRWLRADPQLAGAPPLEIGFNYLGRFDRDAALPIASEAVGDDLAPDTRLPHGLDVTAELRDDGLAVRLVADTGRHPAEWCAALAAGFETALGEIAAHCLDPQAGALSPSDVDFDGLDLADLDAILDGLGED